MRSNHKQPDLQERLSSGAAAKKALLEKFKSAADDPGIAEREAARLAIAQARAVRQAERAAAEKVRQAELAEQAAIKAEQARLQQIEQDRVKAALALEKAAQDANLLAEQKAARDARYAARKAAKKQRRKG